MRHHIASFITSLTFIVLLANAEEQILFVSKRGGNQEIYRQTLGGRPKRLTFEEGSDFDPMLSPDGTKMVYVSTINRIFEIAVMDLKSREHQQLTFSLKSNLHPTWSPDGKRIAFASHRDGNFDIYIMDATGENITQMTNNFPWDDSWPHWSPVNEEIVFTSNQHDGVANVYLLNVRTGDQKQLTNFTYRTAYPKWSPAGIKIAFFSSIFEEVLPGVPLVRRTAIFEDTQSGALLIWRLKPDGTDLEALIIEGTINDQPTFSPDGKWLAFTSEKDKNVEIYSMNIDTQQIIRLTNHPDRDYQPDWSPDGESIAFVSHRDGNPDIYTMTVNGEQLTNLTKSERVEMMPAWSPDGAQIAFEQETVDGRYEIHVMDKNGKNQVKVAAVPFANGSPTWSPQGDKIAFVNLPEKGVEHTRIYTIDINGQNQRLLFEDRDGFIGKIRWSPDGTQIIFSDSHHKTQHRNGRRIGLLDFGKGEVRTIEAAISSPRNAAWLPNSQEIVFSAFPPFPETRHGVFIIDRDGNPLRTILMDAPPSTTDGLAWSPDGGKILFGRGGDLYTLDLTNESVKLFLKSATTPDWQDPSRLRSVSPRNKIKTIWGEIKKRDER